MKPLPERIYYYITATWYESKCKDQDKIKQIIQEELNNPKYNDLPVTKVGYLIKRRCMSEL